MKAIELFCGYGGATEGMKRAGLQLETCYDIWPVALGAHHRWHPDVPVKWADVNELEPDEFEGRFVWASPPCQPWSTANRTKSRGVNHKHYYSLAHFAYQMQLAEIAVLENVAGLVSEKDGREELAKFEAACNKLGLSYSIHVLASSWFGVSQLRRRVIIVIGAMPLFQMSASIPLTLSRAILSTDVKRPRVSRWYR
jgi:DNA (cytosine-5)-methyltransferase 1